MKLTIQNLERLNGLGDYKSPLIQTHTVTPEIYDMIMNYEGYNWNVVIFRDIHPVHNKYRMMVHLLGLFEAESTAIDTGELSSPGLTLSIIESMMDKLLKKK
jgi:hypothetical protein